MGRKPKWIQQDRKGVPTQLPVARLAHTERSLPRPINDSDGTGRLTPCQAGAVSLWTVGCADSRLTAPARSPWTSRGKRKAFPPPCPQVGGCPTSVTALRNSTG